MKLLKTITDYIGKVLGPKPIDIFFKDFEHAAKSRGCVCYFQDATETKTNGAGIVEKYAVEATTTKLVVLPGDPYEQVNKQNLVGFEPLNRRSRRMLEEERRKVYGSTRAVHSPMSIKDRLNAHNQFTNLKKNALRSQEPNTL